MRFFIKNYGCQMNSYDSQRVADVLAHAGHKIASFYEDADIIILNTCSIREKVDEKIFSDLGRIQAMKKKSANDFIIVVAGCMAQTRSADIIRRAPYVDVILGPHNIHQLAEIIDEIVKSRPPNVIISTVADIGSKFPQSSDTLLDRGVSEFITIQEGCNNFCSYCIVPHTRGREFSRSVLDISTEIKNLVSLGVKEITLLGQNVNSYKGVGPDGKRCTFSRLLFELAANISGLKRLRYMTSNPKDVDLDIAIAHKEIEILIPSLHLPVQSGSDSVLKRMNRRYTRDEYMRRVGMLREYRSDLAISSDFIVGFPGESEADFQQTLELAKNIGYAQAYSFKYSPREGTAAAQMDNQIPEDVKSERLQILQDLLNNQQSRFNNDFIGQYVNVLFTKKGKHDKQLTGRSEYSQTVSVNAADTVTMDDIAKVKITEVASHSLVGVVVS
ncbi:MAG: tRNA (N6-isopentenyl adenosine(37)-C2)-methylthiotransferase MiaB [Holosporaceae bacterium]|jgi:tRNA-2-methylthio-N6-dimethylallyladenosine synthase|nr:tRNA (N6-isopentenyl adenosine(37)-C2)-methylthiotransferase MiaB [Holosporaceae bacterium]